MKDYYLILKIPRDASSDDIRRAHRKQALHYHPDRSIEPDPRKFREIQEAYEVLRDQSKREDYDDRLKASEQEDLPVYKTIHSGPISIWEDFDTIIPELEEILDHFKRNFFGAPKKVDDLKDLNVEFVLDLDEAAGGITVPLDVPLYKPCRRCEGRGGAFPFPCLHCDGKGWVWEKQVIPIQIPPGVRSGTVYQVPLQQLGIKNIYLNIHVRVEP